MSPSLQCRRHLAPAATPLTTWISTTTAQLKLSRTAPRPPAPHRRLRPLRHEQEARKGRVHRAVGARGRAAGAPLTHLAHRASGDGEALVALIGGRATAGLAFSVPLARAHPAPALPATVRPALPETYRACRTDDYRASRAELNSRAPYARLTAIVVTTLAVAGCSSSEATGKGSSAATASETLTAAGSIRFAWAAWTNGLKVRPATRPTDTTTSPKAPMSVTSDARVATWAPHRSVPAHSSSSTTPTCGATSHSS